MLVGVTSMQPVEKPSWLDIGSTYIGHSSNVGSFPLPVTALPKARQWCRAIQRQVEATWWAAIETDTQPAAGGELHLEAEAVMVEAALSVAAIQVLYEIFLAAYPRKKQGDMTSSAFEAHSLDSEQGKVVSGLKLVRNGEMHAETISVPNVQRTVGVPFTDETYGYRVFPHWVEYPELPHEFRSARHPPKKGKTTGDLKTNQVHHDNYDSAVGGQLVIETLLDALGFFARCDPRIVSIDEHGEARHFPLPSIVERDYERRHPDWPNRSVVESELRSLCESKPPAGERRVLIASLHTQDGSFLAQCGYTEHEHGYRHMFTETPEQVERDVIEHKFPYWLLEDGIAYPISANESGHLFHDLEAGEPCDLDVPDDEESWKRWFYISRKDAFQYRTQRGWASS